METFENLLLQNSGCPLQGVVFFVGRERAVVDVVMVAFPDAVGAMPVMPITASDVVEDAAVVLAFRKTDREAKDEDEDRNEDSGVILVMRLLGTGERESDDRIDDSCADTHGEKAAQSNRDIVEEIMRFVIDNVRRMNGKLLSPSAQAIRALS